MRKLFLSVAILAAGAAGAQESDQSYLAAFLEDSLSDAGREVRVIGFEGALSSRATFTTLTIADEIGVWLTVEGAVLDWSQSSLLSGDLDISEISASSITLSRLPETGSAALPAPEATGFSLPELPVSIDIGSIVAERIILGETVVGQAVEGRLDATLRLAAGSGAAQLALVRTGEGPSGEILLDAAYDNATRILDLSLSASEAEGGVVTSFLGVPGAPATDFQLKGVGEIEAFAADVALATAGEERLSGKVTLAGEDGGGYRLLADLSGNLAPLIVPEHAEFLGTDIRLKIDARRAESGRVTLDMLSLQAQSLALEATGSLAADGMPEDFKVSGTLAAPDGQPLLLPFGDVPTRLDRAEFQISADQADGTGWRALAQITGLNRVDMDVDTLSLSGSGRIGRTPAGNSFGGTLKFAANGLRPADAPLARAMGQSITGGFKFHLLEGSSALGLSDIRLAGEDYSSSGHLQVEGLGKAFLTTGALEIVANDLSRFALVTGRPLAGDGTILLSGSASGLSGVLDGIVEVSARNLQLGIKQIDRMLAGVSKARLSILRDELGTTIRSFDISAGTFFAQGKGKLASSGSALQGTLAIGDLASLDPRYGGTASVAFGIAGTPEAASLSLTGEAADLSLDIPSVDVLLAGKSDVSAELALTKGTTLISSALLSNRQIKATLSGEAVEDGQRLAVDAKLTDLSLLIPDMKGPLTLSGVVTEAGPLFRLDLDVRGPGQVDGTISGQVAASLTRGDLKISGTGQAGLANPLIAPRLIEGPVRYDLRLNGPLALSSLSGRITLSNGRLSDPGLGFALGDLEGLAELTAGKARLAATSRLSSGGMLRIDGPIGLAAPYPAELIVGLDRIRLFDPRLYEAVGGGSLRVTGPLLGGALVSGDLFLAETEVMVPESGINASGALIDVNHVHEPSEVQATRARAGLIGDSASAGKGPAPGKALRLDLTIKAPGKIFLRGRGIDAELGGSLRLLGTTAAVVPSGAFGLIRGRLDILGKRLILERADLLMEGSFIPTLALSASSESDGITSYVTIEGPADDPEVAFSSSPELPQEEVLARLLFGRGLETVSALQAAQLAQAIAVLAGRSGEGLISKIRKSFGFDDLDVETAEDGTAALTLGKYVSENVYTEVEIEQGGTSRVNLNLDLRPGVTAKGRLGADGETGIGIFVERDY
ncbi:Translocation and assembly module TamB [Paracoccaceae bacterium]|jgi:translocation and assembly module TamB